MNCMSVQNLLFTQVKADNSFQPTAIALRGLSAAEFQR